MPVNLLFCSCNGRKRAVKKEKHCCILINLLVCFIIVVGMFSSAAAAANAKKMQIEIILQCVLKLWLCTAFSLI